MRRYYTFDQAIKETRTMLLEYGVEVDSGHWQGVPTEGKPDLRTVELMGWSFQCPISRQYPDGTKAEDGLLAQLQSEIKPNLPWADNHFAERVSRVPSNPGEQYLNWPWWSDATDKVSRTVRLPIPGTILTGENKFTHTYQERFWPRVAWSNENDRPWGQPQGIRYNYGDLDDLVSLLQREPYTRQAYLAIFFPEDTGAVHGGRIPCTLGYHFMLRNNKLHMWYFLRSCDFVRHFRDDIYLAIRLLLWVLEELVERELRSDGKQVWVDVAPGNLTMVIPSLHFHEGDRHLV